MISKNVFLFAINRSNAFEVSSMDGGASVVLYSENKVELLSWYSAIKDRVVMLLEQSVSFFKTLRFVLKGLESSFRLVLHACGGWSLVYSTLYDGLQCKWIGSA